MVTLRCRFWGLADRFRAFLVSVLLLDDFVSSIGEGLLVTVGIGKLDTDKDMKYLAEKIVNLRIFKDENDKINLSVKDINGDIMLVSNFT